LNSQSCGKVLVAVRVEEATRVVARIMQLRVLDEEPATSSVVFGNYRIPSAVCIINFLAIPQPQRARIRPAHSFTVENDVLPH
jgi:hypothetical protein